MSLKVKSSLLEEIGASYRRQGYANQTQLAEAVGCSRGTIYSFFKGYPILRTIFEEICHQLNLNWQEIVEIPAELAEPRQELTNAP